MTDINRNETQAALQEIADRRAHRIAMRELETERRKDARLAQIARWPRGTRWLALVAAEMVSAPRWAAWLFMWLGFSVGAFSILALQLIYKVSTL